MRRSKPRKGLRRVARWLVRGASAVLALVLAACLLLLALVNTELGRGELVQRVNLLLASTFRGELRIRSVGRVGFGGAADVGGVVIDAAGRRVLEVEGLEVEMPVVPLVWQLLVSRPETTRIDIDRVEARYVRVKLIDDGEGAPTLAQAFQPRRPSAPSQGGAAHVAVRAFELQHGWVHGRLSGFAVDADIDDVLASLTVDSAAVSLDVERARLRARGLPRKLELAGTASLRLELPLEAAPRERLIEAKFGGGSAGASVSLTAKLAGEAVTGTLSVPALEPAALRKLLPESKLQAPVALEARLAGTLQNPKLDAEIGPGEGTVRAHAAVDVEKKSADVTLEVDALDPSLLDPRAPAGAASFSAEAKVSFDREAAVMARYRIRAPPASVGAFELPPADVDGSFELDRDGAWRTDGKAHLLEPGARTEIAYAVRQGGARAAPLVEVSSSTELDEPRRLVNLASGARVSGRLETRVRFDAAEGELRATARGSFAEAKVREVSARRVELDASAVGRVESPRIELDLRLASLRFRGEGYEQGRVKLWGTPERLAVTASFGRPVRLTLHTELTLEPRFRVRGTELVFHGDGRGPVRVSARSLGADDGGIRGRDVRIETPGGGVAEASFEFGNTLRALELRADDFDLRQAFESLDLPLGKEVELPSGKVSLSARYRQTRAGPSGFVRGTFRDLEYGPLRGLRGKVDAELEDGMLDGKLDAHYQGSRLRATFDRVQVRRIPPEALDLEQFRGRVTVVANLVLDGLAPLLPLTALPLESASGKATLRFELARGEGESGRVALDVTTESLALVGERRSAGASKDPELAKSVAPWSLSGVDVDLGAAASEAERRLSLRSRFFDGMGDLARGTAEIRLPESTARRFASWPDAWRRANVSVSLGVVPRAVTEWPPMLRLDGVDGVVSASAQLEGTYAAPELRVMANIARLRAEARRDRGIDVQVAARSTRAGGKLRVGAIAQRRRVAVFDTDWEGDVFRYLTAEQAAQPELRVQGELSDFPVHALPPLAERRVLGHVSGAVFFAGFGGPLRANVHVTSRDFSIEGLAADRLNVSARLDEERLSARVGASGKKLGRFEARVEGPVRFRDGLDVSSFDVRLQARGFELRSLRPLVAGSVSGLEGRVDAELTGRLSPDAPDLRGRLELRDGAMQIPSIGQTFRDIHAVARARPNRIELERLTARGLTGRLTASATAELDGVELRSARAKLRIRERDKLPLTVEGVVLGDAWGDASFAYEAVGERRTRIHIRVPNLELELPEMTPRGVQSLEPAEHVDVGFQRRDGTFVEIPLQPLEEPDDDGSRLIVGLELGKIRIEKGPGVRIELTGSLEARIAKRTRLDGRIELTGGRLDVSGKEFVVENGSITFDRTQPENGVVVARARWDSPAQYAVYAEYTGTVKDGSLDLRSEPPLTEDEILSLLLFGTPDGSFGAGTRSEAAAAIGVAGGTVTKGVNRALSDITNLDVSTRVDTSTGAARPELVVQLSPRTTGRVTQAIGEPSPGQSPDRTFLTLDLRLFRKWSLSTQVGDEGASTVDLIWRHRY